MEYRPIRKEERIRLNELQAMSFFFPIDRKEQEERLQKDDELWRSGWAAVAEDGKIHAGMELIPFDVWFDGHSVGMGGIGGVASLVEERRGGNIRKLFDAIMLHMYERGDVFSYLYPFSHEYYRKFGYELCNATLKIKAPIAPLLQYSRPGRAELFHPGEDGTDPTPIVELYNAFASRHNLAVDREGWRWRGVLEHDPINSNRRCYIWYNEQNKPVAYCILVYPKPLEGYRTDVVVQEAAWLDREALYALLGFIGRYSGNLKTVVWALPQSISAELLWPEPWDVTIERNYTGMNRVVNVPEALKLLRKPEGSGAVRVAVEDSFLQQNTGIYEIGWQDGEGEANRIEGSSSDLECPVQALAQLVTGFLPFDQIALRQDVTVHGKTDELRRLFPKKDLYLPDYF